jgi:hypothetical protein
MNDSFIGFWVGRVRGKLHLAESEITDRVVMRCGRQMRLVTKSGGELLLGGNVGRCLACDNERRA